jgi:hypothetical protein
MMCHPQQPHPRFHDEESTLEAWSRDSTQAVGLLVMLMEDDKEDDGIQVK